MLYIFPPYLLLNSESNDIGNASPPIIISFTPRSFPSIPSSPNSICALVGVSCIISTPLSLTKSPRAFISTCSSSLAITTVSPFDSATRLSSTNMSKHTVVTHSILFPLSNSILSPKPSIKLLTPLFFIFTPFGFPVDPDVYITYARSSAPLPSSRFPLSPLNSSSHIFITSASPRYSALSSDPFTSTSPTFPSSSM